MTATSTVYKTLDELTAAIIKAADGQPLSAENWERIADAVPLEVSAEIPAATLWQLETAAMRACDGSPLSHAVYSLAARQAFLRMR